ncbi:hypothetical protein [uncultured Cellulomonas sp.]|uniref:hypothetical protein n=1 Tax=uncultured Cellulomonas sp. TaxID=189682 RepID=UPI0028E4BF5E|nr:hypothetical protein [uncultured Cellulomonas sp.]
MTRQRSGLLLQVGAAVLVALGLTAFGVLAVRARESELAVAWGLLPGMPDAFWWYAWRWPQELLGWLVLVWAATRRLVSTGSRAAHAPLALGTTLVVMSTVWSFGTGPGLVWAGPIGLIDSDVPAFGPSWWWGVSGPVVVGGALLTTSWLARRFAPPSTAPPLVPLLEAGALVAIPLVTLGVVAVALSSSTLGVGYALTESGLPFVLITLAALAASGGGRTSTVAVLLGLLLMTGLSLLWRPAAYLPFFAVACALALVPTARGIAWLTAPRRPVPTGLPVSVAEGTDADDRARA